MFRCLKARNRRCFGQPLEVLIVLNRSLPTDCCWPICLPLLKIASDLDLRSMEWADQLLMHAAEGLRLILESLSVLSVGVGLLAVFSPRGPLRLRAIPPRLLERGPLTAARLTFGGWLALALEFQLGADVVQTTISRDASALIQLGAVALVRTFLNYFLSLELKEKEQAS